MQKRAGKYAISLSNISGADIIVLNVTDTDYLDALPQQDLRESLGKELREEGKKAVERFKESLEDSQSMECAKTLTSPFLSKKANLAKSYLKPWMKKI